MRDNIFLKEQGGEIMSKNTIFDNEELLNIVIFKINKLYEKQQLRKKESSDKINHMDKNLYSNNNYLLKENLPTA